MPIISHVILLPGSEASNCTPWSYEGVGNKILPSVVLHWLCGFWLSRGYRRSEVYVWLQLHGEAGDCSLPIGIKETNRGISFYMWGCVACYDTSCNRRSLDGLHHGRSWFGCAENWNYLIGYSIGYQCYQLVNVPDPPSRRAGHTDIHIISSVIMDLHQRFL